MKLSQLVILAIILSIIIGIILFQDKRAQKIAELNNKLEFLNYACNTYEYRELEMYKLRTGQYPKNRQIVESIVYPKYERERIQSINPAIQYLHDPFSDSILVYSPILLENNVVDYLIYSIGPDRNDDNRKRIKYFNSGLVDTLNVVFRLPNDKLNFCSNLNFDVLVYIPHSFIKTGRIKNSYYSDLSKYQFDSLSVDSNNWIN